MDTTDIENIIARRFRLERSPTLVARPAAMAPIVFSRLRSTQALRGRSMSVPPERSFSFQIPLSMPFFSGLWLSGRRLPQTSVAPGDAFLFDLGTNPTVGLANPFDSVRINIPCAALDALAHDRGLGRIGGLRQPTFGGRDMVLHGLAQALVAVMERPGDASALFADYTALAFHDHVIHAYGGVTTLERHGRGGLAPWQLRRIHAFLDAHLERDPPIAQLAAECSLSAHHFARAFKRTMGMPPHQWLVKRRIGRARQLLQETDRALSDIALACGFVDQSHFTRTFSRSEGCSPGRWRRNRRA